MSVDPCSGCTAAFAAASATVRHDGNGVWRRVGDDTFAHLVALFRDPGIADGRVVDIVLDLHVDPARCMPQRWHSDFLRALARLPAGIVVALDNGVRCPCPQSADSDRSLYRSRVEACLPRTRAWLDTLRHPDGGRPGIVICDRDLSEALGRADALQLRSGAPWTSPDPWIDAVGREITVIGQPGLVLAHPVVLQRQIAYRNAVATAVPRLITLART